MRVVVAVAVLSGGVTAATAQDRPECFGAAARDAANPCDNPDLRFSATPSPEDAPLLPALPCTFVRYKTPHVCAFATSKKRAKGSIALLGDSHAPAWRAAVNVLARNRRWHGLTLARSSCPFSRATHSGASRKAAKTCATWVRGVYAWFRRHREVHTVLFVNSTAYDFTTDAIDGYRAALDALPPTVERIVVIRDNPKATIDTLPCVARALRREREPGVECALDRDDVLPLDPAAEAAPRLANDRGRTIDLTPFFCDDHCYPVVGGVLVYKDTSHITQVFSRTLGPYLAAEFRALSPSA